MILGGFPVESVTRNFPQILPLWKAAAYEVDWTCIKVARAQLFLGTELLFSKS